MSETSKEQELEILAREVAPCVRCKLNTTRTQTVFGEGNPNAEVMFIGEGPGKQEDLTGRPFVGKAGELLTRIIERGMGVSRDRVYIANVTKCRPTVDLKFEKDRPPEDDEVVACSPFLLRQISIIQPKVIITLGNPSTRFILRTKEGITKLRGNWGDFHGIPVMPTYHPSYVIRNGGENSPLKRDVWEDIKKVLDRLDWKRPG
ncbi:uracil-DNA glycosylase [Leptospira hartskeerlii]|uniref:Type-4 uracil-DNA glycosylase n=1 Tax=Leptospira hartskeerlii TaxID=2023177 RepID=A0A2M9XIV0_9LEPT|nr:uracil-DNA glycosylase [Leptospira hartskeerlii]PJZ27564.1 uracil-DNA glycosylase [Leptospira hartskeerlii]PJZ34096.1 uracil-DNA glycosylase [Leptospira hartskeerlii]